MQNTGLIPLQRAQGRAAIGYRASLGKNTLTRLHQSGCLKLMLPKNHHPTPDGVLINTAGGLTGGDRLDIRAQLGAASHLRLATQTAERVYKSIDKAPATITTEFTLDDAAALTWLPQETILFDGGQMQRRLTVKMGEGASYLGVEMIVLGRTGMGEVVASGMLKDSWRIYRSGRLVFADALRLCDFANLTARGALGSANSIGTLLYVSPHAERMVARLKEFVHGAQSIGNSAKNGAQSNANIHGGVSFWNGLILVRLVSDDALRLRRLMICAIEMLDARPLPRVWTM